MKTMIAAIALLAVGATAMPNDAHAIGCLSGAAVGGVAGHYAGHHGLLGAAAGCAVGHHEKVVRRRTEERSVNAPYNNGYAPR
jgi:hypothetical protein